MFLKQEKCTKKCVSYDDSLNHKITVDLVDFEKNSVVLQRTNWSAQKSYIHVLEEMLCLDQSVVLSIEIHPGEQILCVITYSPFLCYSTLLGFFFLIECMYLRHNLFLSVSSHVQRLLIFQILVFLLKCEFLPINTELFINRNFPKAGIPVGGILLSDTLFNTMFREWSR